MKQEYYTKKDVQFHSDPFKPAINVKAYSFPSISDIQEKWNNCNEKTAENALNFAFEMGQEEFWDNITGDVKFYLKNDNVKIYSEGRSGGWLIVEGYKDFEFWDAIDLMKWRRFEIFVKKEIKYLTSQEKVLEDIEANQWYKERSEKYNYTEDNEGNSCCIADLKEQAIEAGYGSVIR